MDNDHDLQAKIDNEPLFKTIECRLFYLGGESLISGAAGFMTVENAMRGDYVGAIFTALLSLGTAAVAVAQGGQIRDLYHNNKK